MHSAKDDFLCQLYFLLTFQGYDCSLLLSSQVLLWKAIIIILLSDDESFAIYQMLDGDHS